MVMEKSRLASLYIVSLYYAGGSGGSSSDGGGDGVCDGGGL